MSQNNALRICIVYRSDKEDAVVFSFLHIGYFALFLCCSMIKHVIRHLIFAEKGEEKIATTQQQ